MKGDDEELDDLYDLLFNHDYFLNRVMGWDAMLYYQSHVDAFNEKRRTYSPNEDRMGKARGALDPWNIKPGKLHRRE